MSGRASSGDTTCFTFPKGQATARFLSSVPTKGGGRPVGSHRKGAQNKKMLAHICTPECVSAKRLCVCRCVSGGSVSGLCRSRPVINVPGRLGPKRYITNRRGGRVHGGAAAAVVVGGGGLGGRGMGEKKE